VRNRQGPRHLSRIALSLLAAAPLLIGASAPAGQDVRVDVSGLRSTKGLVQVCMTARRDRFPECKGDALAFTATLSAAGSRTVTFAHVPPGHYAIALLHDENGNGKVDRTLLIPREGFGFSRDARVTMGPPKFDAAAFDVGAVPVRQAIRMRYLL